MKRPPIQGTAGKILTRLDEIFRLKKLLTSKSGLKFYISRLTDKNNNICNICIVRLHNGYLIETDYPNQTNAFERLWMCDPELGRITYTESTNPNLKTKYDYFNIPLKQAEALEFHAMPSDLDFLLMLLEFAVNIKDLNQHTSTINTNDFKLLRVNN